MDKKLFIINPASGGGSGGNTWDRYRRHWPALFRDVDPVLTLRPGHAREIAASSGDRDLLVAVGGDGTVNEITNGLMEISGRRPALAILPAGSGNDFAAAIGAGHARSAVRAYESGTLKAIDLMRVEYQKEGLPMMRYGLAYCNTGFSGIRWIQPWMKRLLPSRAAYYLATVAELLSFRAPTLSVRWEGGSYEGKAISVLSSHIECIGAGGMRIAPDARPGDGRMWTSVIPYSSHIQMLRMLPKISTGGHLSFPGVQYFQTQEIEIESHLPVRISIDGDLVGTTPHKGVTGTGDTIRGVGIRPLLTI